MTIDEKKEMIDNAETIEELEEVRKKIEEDPEEKPEETTEATEETTEVAEEKPEETPEERKAEPPFKTITKEEERALIRDAVDEKELIERKGEKKMELRNSKEYVDAYAEYIKTGDEKELRALITTGGYATGNSATVEVPDLVWDIVKTAWEREEIMQLVRTISVDGNFKVQFEVSGSEAAVHTEGQTATSEEELILGVVTLTPESIKKWISVSDEVVDLRGEAFLRYIYDEITYRIAKKTADQLIGKIAQLPQSLSTNDAGVYDTVSAAKITKAPALGLVAEAIANLSDETRDITIVMNKLTYAKFKEVQYAAGYGIDPFEGARVRFNNTLPAYDTANGNAVYMIVGDFYNGTLANYPNGEGIDIKYDDTTLMTADLVRILGRRFVAAEPVADKSFTLVAKPASV